MANPVNTSQQRRALGHGEFFGGVQRRVEAPGLVFAVMEPDAHRDVEVHTHATAHVILHVRGRYLSSAAGSPGELTGPAVVLNPPGTTHRDRYARREGRIAGRFLSVALSAAWWARVTDGMAPTGDATLRSDASTLAHGARLLRTVGGEFDDVAALEAEALVLELLARDLSPDAEAGGNAPPEWLARAVAFLRDQSGAGVTVRAAAAACDVHPVHLARVCRRHLGMSPAGVVRSERLERAATLLARSVESVSSVAARCGFADHAHLTRAFRRAHGLTPRAYRAAFR